MNQDFLSQRQKMVQEQLVRRGIANQAVLNAMNTVPRHLFIPPELSQYAYSDGPLPIGEGQTISQPYIVALMTEASQIDGSSKVLEIGTGSGYAAAILGKIAKEVHTIERLSGLAQSAESLLASLDYSNVHVHPGDGSLGWPSESPFDAILVTAGAPMVPSTLFSQLKAGGRMIIPVGDALSQQLIRLRKNEQGGFQQEVIELVRFVPLIGQEGW
jgi:protein-L-isoaspartate(D-aspartate) O-methyltransferase